MNRAERLLDLITYLLNSPEPVSWQEIKNQFPDDYSRGVEESNQRKFERDKAELISLAIPIDYHSGSGTQKEGYTIEEDKLFLPEIEFTAQESSLLMLSASAVLENQNFPYHDQLESVLHKITSTNHQISPPPSEIAITYANGQTTNSRSVWAKQIQDALDRKKTIDIIYHAFSTGKTTRRKVNSYGLIFRRGNWMLVGWDHLRKDLRSFVLTRIKTVTINTRRPGTPDYDIPKTFSLKDYQYKQPWEIELHEPITITLRVSTHRLPEILPQLTTAKKLSKNTFEIIVTNRLSLIPWVLSHKTDVEVLAPKEIRDEILKILREM